MITLVLSEVAVNEILEALADASKRWKVSLPIEEIPFSDYVINKIRRQMSVIKEEIVDEHNRT